MKQHSDDSTHVERPPPRRRRRSGRQTATTWTNTLAGVITGHKQVGHEYYLDRIVEQAANGCFSVGPRLVTIKPSVKRLANSSS